MEQILNILPSAIRSVFSESGIDFMKLQEIRLRIDKPVLLIYENEERFLKKGTDLCFVTKEQIKECMEYISNYSLYAFEEEMRQGFITIQGGHRIGIAGKAVLKESRVQNMRYISFINIRLAHQIQGCADFLMKYIAQGNKVYPTLIISPPRCGKTTILRDIIRQISNGFSGLAGRSVGVVDERSELGACYMGIPQNDLGLRTDVLDCCPKAEGMMMLIRSMAPEVIAVDEIGMKEDIEAMAYARNCGCTLIATAHGNSMEDIRTKPILGQLIKEHAFCRYIVLGKEGRAGTVCQIFDERGSLLYGEC